MGLFDKILGGQSSESTALSKEEAFASILLVTVAADGHISDEEAATFNSIINRMQLYRNVTGQQFSQMMDKLIGLLKKHGHQNLLERAFIALPPDLRLTAFAVCTDLVFADGSVEQEEKETLENIQSSLQIPEDQALQIIEVMSIKNRG
jgi:uncharacterized tellurite resistance protein B-like protein